MSYLYKYIRLNIVFSREKTRKTQIQRLTADFDA